MREVLYKSRDRPHDYSKHGEKDDGHAPDRLIRRGHGLVEQREDDRRRRGEPDDSSQSSELGRHGAVPFRPSSMLSTTADVLPLLASRRMSREAGSSNLAATGIRSMVWSINSRY